MEFRAKVICSKCQQPIVSGEGFCFLYVQTPGKEGYQFFHRRFRGADCWEFFVSESRQQGGTS